MAVKIQIKDMAALKKKLRAMEKAPQKVVNGVMGDIRKRAPSWVATEVAQTYGVKKAEITGQKIGTVKVRGASLEDVQIVYTGRVLTPTHFSMSPTAPKEGSYTMAKFQNNAITDNGRALLSHVQMGAVFTPTKIVLGSGYIPPGKTARTMTEVASPVKELPITKKQRTNDAKAIFGGVYSNQDITQDWYFRELALYAKAVYPEGQEIAEVLYSYGNAGDQADLMPSYASGQPVERQMDLVVYVGNDTKIDLTIQSGVYMTRPETIELIEEYLADIDLSITDITTQKKYKWGIDNGIAYLEEVE